MHVVVQCIVWLLPLIFRGIEASFCPKMEALDLGLEMVWRFFQNLDYTGPWPNWKYVFLLQIGLIATLCYNTTLHYSAIGKNIVFTPVPCRPFQNYTVPFLNVLVWGSLTYVIVYFWKLLANFSRKRKLFLAHFVINEGSNEGKV